MTTKQPLISFVGAGNMASAITGGMISYGIPADSIRAADPFPQSRENMAAQFGIQTFANNHDALQSADVVVLAVKPQQMQAVCGEIRDTLVQQQPLVISIAAGISCQALENWLDDGLSIVRCMPNTPALVQKGASALFANANVSPAQKQLAEQLLEAIGTVDWVDDETLLNAVTAVSGSGPAYFFLVMEALTDAGIKLGLEPETARNLTLQTALGAATMACESDVDVAELRRRVMSPGGTTEAAIKQFEADNFRQLFNNAVQAACERSITLAQELE